MCAACRGSSGDTGTSTQIAAVDGYFRRAMVLKALLYVLYPPFKVAKRLMCSLGDSAAVLPEGAVEPVAEAKVGMPLTMAGPRAPKAS